MIIHNFLARLKRITPSMLRGFFYFKILDFNDAIIDRYITGYNLSRIITSPIDVKKRGGTRSQPTRYLILKKVFSHVSLSANDSFIDVGCGQGRVLAFLMKEHSPCSIYGVELSEVVGKVAAEWTKKYSNISVTLGDAFLLDYNQYTVLYLSQPFYPKVFIEFVQLIERQLSHPITLIYIFDHSSGGYLEGRKGWNLKYREEFFKIHKLQVVGEVRRFSIWEYSPDS